MDKKDRHRVSIIIPNHNGINLLSKYLPDVMAAAGKNEVIVVDDNSDDGSEAFIKSNFPGIVVLENDKRLGFARSVNRGVKAAHCEIVVLLNSDVKPEKEFISYLLPHFDNPLVFAVGCLEKSHEAGGVVLRGRGIGYWSQGFYLHHRGDTDRHDTAWVSGGSGAFRKNIWLKLGGLDGIFAPFYWEDIDICYRARKSGYKIGFEPKSIVHHHHDNGAIRTEYQAGYVRLISYRNQILFFWKNITDPFLIGAHLLRLPVHLTRSIISSDPALFLAFLWSIVYLPKIIIRRFQPKTRPALPDRSL